MSRDTSFRRNYKTRADDLTDLLIKIIGLRNTEKELVKCRIVIKRKYL